MPRFRSALLLLPLVTLASSAAAAPSLGTPLAWHADAAEAGAVAGRSGKLVLQVLVSGDFTKQREISLAGERLRDALRDPLLRPLLARFVGAHRTAGSITMMRRNRAQILRVPGGDVALLVLTPTGRVVHAVAGALPPDELARELRWALANADPARLTAAHRAAARKLSRLRLLKPVAVQPVGHHLTELGVRVKRQLPPRVRRALIHSHLAANPNAAPAETGAFVWRDVLGQTPSTHPVVVLRMPFRCRIPRRMRCGLRIRPIKIRQLKLELKRIKKRIQKLRPRITTR